MRWRWLILRWRTFPAAGCKASRPGMVAPPMGARIGQTGLSANEIRIPVGPPKRCWRFGFSNPRLPPRARFLVLHGFIGNHNQVQAAAKALQRAGYRAVMVISGARQVHGRPHHLRHRRRPRPRELTDYLQRKSSVAMRSASSARPTVPPAPFSLRLSIRASKPSSGRPVCELRQEAPSSASTCCRSRPVMSHADYVGSSTPWARRRLRSPTRAAAGRHRKNRRHIRLFHGTWDLVVPSKASEELARRARSDEVDAVSGKGIWRLCSSVWRLRSADEGVV